MRHSFPAAGGPGAGDLMSEMAKTLARRWAMAEGNGKDHDAGSQASSPASQVPFRSSSPMVTDRLKNSIIHQSSKTDLENETDFGRSTNR